MNIHSHHTPGIALRIALWSAQIIAAAIYVTVGYTKFMTPMPDLSKTMPWTREVSQHFVRFIGLIDIAGGLGILLPSLTRIMPNITILAASCCTLLQIFAILFHSWRGEFIVLPLNIVLISLSIFVLWGRSKKAPILPFFGLFSCPR